jgi:hypothetical protein
MFAFGDDVPASYVEFVDTMISGTHFEVLAEFFPNFEALDKFAVEVNAFEKDADRRSSAAPATGSPPIGHSRKLHSLLPDSTPDRGRRCRAHGAHRAPRDGQRRDRPAAGICAAAPVARAEVHREEGAVSADIRRVGAEPRRSCTVVHAAFEAPPSARPALGRARRDRQSSSPRLAAHGGLLARIDGTPVGALVLDPVGLHAYLRRFGVVPDAAGSTVSRRPGPGRRWWRPASSASTT